MKLIKINTDHYIIVDDSEIKEGDCYYWEVTKTIQIAKLDNLNRLTKNSDGSKKITHSTQPLEDVGLGKYDLRFNKIFALDLDEVKELIGEVDVEKKAGEYAINDFDDYAFCGYVKGYNQAIEDNKDKKYTKENLYRLMEILTNTESRMMFEVTTRIFIESLQKNEWEVEIIDGQLKQTNNEILHNKRN